MTDKITDRITNKTIREIPQQKPASPPEIIEFLRELLLTAYQENLTGIIYVAWGDNERQAHGRFDQSTTLRDLERSVDMMDAWVSDIDLTDEFEEEEEE